MRCRKIVLTTLALLGCLATACGGPPPPDASLTTTPVPEQITLLAQADAAVTPMHDMVLAGMAERDLNIRVQWTDLPYDSVYKKGVEIGQQKSDTYDLIMMDDPWVPEFALNGYISDLDALNFKPDQGFITSTLEVGYWPPRQGARTPGIAADAPSHLYAVSIIGDTQLFFYRKDLISNPPETWDDLVTHKDKVNVASKRFLLAMRGAAGNPVVTEWFPYLYSFGGEMFDDHWQVKFNSPEGVAALELFIDLMQYQPAEVANFDAQEQGSCYLQDQCITNIEWTGYIQLAEDAANSKVSGKTGWTIPPRKVRHASELGTFLLAVPAGSKHKEAAVKFINWFTSDKIQQEFASRRGTPVKAMVFNDPQLQQKFPWLPAIHSALDHAVARPRTPEWSKVEQILGRHLHAAVLKQETPKAALDEAAAEVTTLLQGKGYGR